MRDDNGFSGSRHGGPPEGGYGGLGYGGYPPPRRRRSGVFSHLGVALLAAALAAGITLGAYRPGDGGSPTSGRPVTGPAPASSAAGRGPVDRGTRQVVNQVQPGVVIINTALQFSSETAAGTGMVIRPDGVVLTNNHVIYNATKISATVEGSGRTYAARVIGYDKSRDVAVLRLQGARGLRTVPLGNSSAVRSGQRVVAMGNAEGQGSIVPAAGTVTAVGVTVTAADQGSALGAETLHGMIQTSADVVAGDSGGPLAERSGQVIGMDTAGNATSSPQGSRATGFAIPINAAMSTARQIEAGHGSAAVTIGYPPFLGVFLGTGANSNPRAQAALPGDSPGGAGGIGGPGGLAVPGTTPGCVTSNAALTVPSQIAPVRSGTLVIGVICGSPAAAAGLTPGSVITAVDGQAAGSPRQFTGLIARYRPGQVVSVSWATPSGHHGASRVHLRAGPPK